MVSCSSFFAPKPPCWFLKQFSALITITTDSGYRICPLLKLLKRTGLFVTLHSYSPENRQQYHTEAESGFLFHLVNELLTIVYFYPLMLMDVFGPTSRREWIPTQWTVPLLYLGVVSIIGSITWWKLRQLSRKHSLEVSSVRVCLGLIRQERLVFLFSLMISTQVATLEGAV